MTDAMAFPYSRSSAEAQVAYKPHLPPETRLAKTYEQFHKFDAVLDDWPCGVSSYQPGLHDIQHLQAILANDANFAASSKCDLFELSQAGRAWWRGIDDRTVIEHLKVSNVYLLIDSTQGHRDHAILLLGQFSALCRKHAALHGIQKAYFARFCNLRTDVDKASFGCQLSLSQSIIRELFRHFEISPHFLQMIVGDLNYRTPGNFSTYDDEGGAKSIGKWIPLPYLAR